MRPLFIITALFFLLPGIWGKAQDAPIISDAVSTEAADPLPLGLSVKLDISKRSLKNFLTDETAQRPFQNADGSLRDFTGAFTLGSPEARFVPIWDPSSCRLVAVLDLEQSHESSPEDPDAPDAGAPYRLLAEGLTPTSALSGANGEPAYFGVRLVSGRPEFLYTHGSHAVAEMVWLEDEGAIMKQRFSFRKGLKELKLSFPESWVSLITPSLGEWDGNILKASGDSITEVTLLYRLDMPVAAKEEPEGEE